MQQNYRCTFVNSYFVYYYRINIFMQYSLYTPSEQKYNTVKFTCNNRVIYRLNIEL